MNIILNLFWNLSGMSLLYAMFMSPFDLLYIIFKRGAIERFRPSAYFTPFDVNCHWKKRFPYVDYPKREDKQKKTIIKPNPIPYSPLTRVPDTSKMDKSEFKDCMCWLLRKIGYRNVEQTGLVNNCGADILALKPVGSGYEKVCIRCRRNTKPMSENAVEEIYYAKQQHKCDIAIAITDSVFTASAIELAKDYGVILWDKHTLADMHKNANLDDNFDKKIVLEEDFEEEIEENDDSLSYEEIDNFDILDE